MAVGPSLPAETLARGRWKLLKRRHLSQKAVIIPTAPEDPMVTALLPQAHIKRGRQL
jgi:hypothetical protein